MLGLVIRPLHAVSFMLPSLTLMTMDVEGCDALVTCQAHKQVCHTSTSLEIPASCAETDRKTYFFPTSMLVGHVTEYPPENVSRLSVSCKQLWRV